MPKQTPVEQKMHPFAIAGTILNDTERDAVAFWVGSMGQNSDNEGIADALDKVARDAMQQYVDRCVQIYEVWKAGPKGAQHVQTVYPEGTK